MYKIAKELIEKAKKIAVFIHISPDGDCLGSACAMYMFLTKMGKTVELFSDEEKPVTEKLKIIPNWDKFNITTPSSYDLGIAVDCGEEGRMGDKNLKAYVACKETLIIDHHSTGEKFTKAQIVEPSAASATQIIFKILSFIDEKLIDKDIATALMVGLLTDSGGLTFDCVTPESFFVAGKLLEKGVDLAELSRRIFKNITKNVFDLSNLVMSDARFFKCGRIALITFKPQYFKETGTDKTDTEGFINRALNIDTVEVAISILPDEGHFKFGFRSKNYVDVGKIAQALGGGGHIKAAGCRMYGTFDEVVDKVITMIAEKLHD